MKNDNKNFVNLDIERYNELLRKERILNEDAANVVIDYKTTRHLGSYPDCISYERNNYHIVFFNESDLKNRFEELLEERENLKQGYKAVEETSKKMSKEYNIINNENYKLKEKINKLEKPWYKFW